MSAYHPQALVYSRNGKLPRGLREHMDGWVQLIPTPPERWAATDYYVVPTQLSAAVERAAARLGAIPVVMPQGADWLNEKLLTAGRPVALFWAWRVGAQPGDHQ